MVVDLNQGFGSLIKQEIPQFEAPSSLIDQKLPEDYQILISSIEQKMFKVKKTPKVLGSATPLESNLFFPKYMIMK